MQCCLFELGLLLAPERLTIASSLSGSGPLQVSVKAQEGAKQAGRQAASGGKRAAREARSAAQQAAPRRGGFFGAAKPAAAGGLHSQSHNSASCTRACLSLPAIQASVCKSWRTEVHVMVNAMGLCGHTD